MDPVVLLLFVISLAFAALCRHLGWRMRGPNPFAWKAQASFLVSLLLILPFLGGVLVAQSRAPDRLRALGVEPHPEVRHVVGWAMGIGARPVWMFRANGEPGALLDHYLHPSTRPGWELLSHTPGLELLLEREEMRLWITARQDGRRGASLTYYYLP
jgi:hypothetical protein